MVAAMFGPDQLRIAEWLIKVPGGMLPDEIVEQVLSTAREQGALDLPEGDMVYVALRLADDDDLGKIAAMTAPGRTLH